MTQNPEFFQILQEQYRTEHYGPWHLKECHPLEYDTKIQECIQLASKSDSQWFLQQAKILQKRAAYIRHEWAKQATQQATQASIQLAIESTTQPVPAIQPASAIQPAPVPQLAQKEKEQEVEKKAEKFVHNIKTASSIGLLSRILHQATMPNDGKTFLSSGAAIINEITISSLPVYIRYPKDLEATGQG